MNEIFILGAARTPIGSLGGTLASVPAPKLGAAALGEALRRAKLAPEAVDEVVMGNVLSAGVGQAPARQASLGAGLPDSVGAVTVNKVCGSGLKAVMLAAQSLMTGDSRAAAAGGMESMSGAPYLLPKARSGYRLGHDRLVDSLIHDGLWDPYGDVHMGICGELCAEEHGISREEQDAWALKSYERARAAAEAFKDEIVAVEGVAQDEEPGRAKLEKLGRLRPAFKKDGTITAANASKLNDGAAALVLATGERTRELGAEPLARIAGWATHSQEPKRFTTAPAGAIEKLLARVGWKTSEVDLFEVNEAFAVVAVAVSRLAKLDPEKVNVHGGAVALGHPIGASGARLVVTLLNALKLRKAKRGVAAICLGGGEAVALAVERP